jgi:hypothetical protein
LRLAGREKEEAAAAYRANREKERQQPTQGLKLARGKIDFLQLRANS